MGKPTPGPWVLGKQHKSRVEIGSKDHSWTDLARVVTIMSDGHMSAEGLANARLIAAAPDLLAALEAMIPEGWDDGAMDHMPGIKQARAAIAKARGEA